jgi:hypothetical protein
VLYFSHRVSCFCPGLTLDPDPPVPASHIAGSTDVLHHTWFVLWERISLTFFFFFLSWPQTTILPSLPPSSWDNPRSLVPNNCVSPWCPLGFFLIIPWPFSQSKSIFTPAFWLAYSPGFSPRGFVLLCLCAVVLQRNHSLHTVPTPPILHCQTQLYFVCALPLRVLHSFATDLPSQALPGGTDCRQWMLALLLILCRREEKSRPLYGLSCLPSDFLCWIPYPPHLRYRDGSL